MSGRENCVTRLLELVGSLGGRFGGASARRVSASARNKSDECMRWPRPRACSRLKRLRHHAVRVQDVSGQSSLPPSGPPLSLAPAVASFGWG